MDDRSSENGAEGMQEALLLPTLSFSTITFSDGTTLSLEEDDIVVFVGPNNAGKSAALKELEIWASRSQKGVVVSSATMKRVGGANDLKVFLEKNAQKTLSGNGKISYGGIGYSVSESLISYFENDTDRSHVSSFFTKRLTTESRIIDSGAAPGIALFHNPPTHPIHTLLMDEELSADISEKFRHAFGEDLTPFRAGGSSYPLYVGNRPTPKEGKDELSREFVEILQRTNVMLDNQGDGMRSFAAVLIHILASGTQSIQFLDEPEAFLHPPQARLLGKYIAESRRVKSQLFISTHSTDILDGLIDGGSDKVRIIRLRRDHDVNRVRELGKEQTRLMAKDTLTRFSRVFDGIFFEHVVICESDADCMFYQSVLNLPAISGDRRPDVLFVHTAGKHRMAKLADTLGALDVPVSVIADIDILSDESVLRNLIGKLGGDWQEFRPNWKAVVDAVVAQRPPLNATQVASMIAAEIEAVTGTGEFPLEKERSIKRVFKAVSPWS